VRVALLRLETPDDYDRVFAAITSPAIGMTLDPAHFCAARVDLPALVERFAPRVLHVDLKDNAAPGRHEAVPYGTGVVDLEDLVERLVRRGYHGYLVVELAKSQRGLVTEEQLRAGVELARRLCQRLG
jgi:sugar phosphate isomerase/epimerase